MRITDWTTTLALTLLVFAPDELSQGQEMLLNIKFGLLAVLVVSLPWVLSRSSR